MAGEKLSAGSPFPQGRLDRQSNSWWPEPDAWVAGPGAPSDGLKREVVIVLPPLLLKSVKT